MNTYEVVGPTGVPQTKAMYPGRGLYWSPQPMYPSAAQGPAAPFGAILSRSSRSISSRARPARRQSPSRRADPSAAARGRAEAAIRRGEAAERRADSRNWRQAYTRQTGGRPPAGLRREIERAEAAFGDIVWSSSRSIPSQLRQRIERGVTSSVQAAKKAVLQAAARKAAVQAAAQKAASARSYQSYYRQKGTTPPAGMKEKIQRANIEIARRKAETAARKEAEEAREKARRAKIAVHPKRPPAKAGIREWEAYYKATGTSLSPSHRRKLELPEKTAFANATGAILFIPKSFTQQSGVGVSHGVTWMFPVAYGKDSMPYWDLWFDKKATARDIGEKVAEDYKREIMRRVGIQTKYRTEREAWQDAGKPGPGPTIDPHEGIHSPITPPKTYAPAPRRPTIAPPKTYAPARAPIAPPKLSVPARAPIAPPKLSVPAPRRRVYLPLPTLGQTPGAFSITRTTIVDPRTGASRILVATRGQGFKAPVGKPRQADVWLRQQMGAELVQQRFSRGRAKQIAEEDFLRWRRSAVERERQRSAVHVAPHAVQALLRPAAPPAPALSPGPETRSAQLAPPSRERLYRMARARQRLGLRGLYS